MTAREARVRIDSWLHAEFGTQDSYSRLSCRQQNALSVVCPAYSCSLYTVRCFRLRLMQYSVVCVTSIFVLVHRVSRLRLHMQNDVIRQLKIKRKVSDVSYPSMHTDSYDKSHRLWVPGSPLRGSADHPTKTREREYVWTARSWCSRARSK